MEVIDRGRQSQFESFDRFCFEIMHVQGIESVDFAEGIIDLNTRLDFWKILQGGRVVYQDHHCRMEVNMAEGTISDQPKREAEDLARELRK